MAKRRNFSREAKLIMSTLSIGYVYIIWAYLNSKCETFKLISPKS